MNKQTQQNLLNMVKSNYEEIADDFDASRKKTLWPELIKLAGSVRDGDKVLDAGCGNGRLLAAFAEKNISYLGVDNSRKLIEAAKRNQELGIKNQEFLVGDILELDKISEKDFDYVFCIAVWHHLPGEDSRIRALEQIKNKLKPASAGSARGGGKAIITVWNLWHKKKYRRLIFKFAILKILGRNKMDFGDILFDWKNSLAENISRRYYHAFTKGELKKTAVRAGFKINKLYKDKYNYYLILENK
ncbi:MAG: class I SAM-dependent methyltransferase [bacterium]|nr:class I SAM-dependent methyltransferase [bacterium]